MIKFVCHCVHTYSRGIVPVNLKGNLSSWTNNLFIEANSLSFWGEVIFIKDFVQLKGLFIQHNKSQTFLKNYDCDCHRIIKSFFSFHRLTDLMIPLWCWGQHKNNGVFSGQIGPQEPSGLFSKVFSHFSQKIVVVRSFARSLSFHITLLLFG